MSHLPQVIDTETPELYAHQWKTNWGHVLYKTQFVYGGHACSNWMLFLVRPKKHTPSCLVFHHGDCTKMRLCVCLLPLRGGLWEISQRAGSFKFVSQQIYISVGMLCIPLSGCMCPSYLLTACGYSSSAFCLKTEWLILGLLVFELGADIKMNYYCSLLLLIQIK